MAAKDVIVIAALLFSFGIGFFIMHYALNITVDSMIANPIINASSNATQVLGSISTLTNKFDYVIFGLFIGLTLGMIITGWFVAGVPLFMFIYFLVVVIAVIFSAIASNIWESVTTAAIFGLTINNFPITNHLLNNLPIYITIIGIVGLVVMFAKPAFQRQ